MSSSVIKNTYLLTGGHISQACEKAGESQRAPDPAEKHACIYKGVHNSVICSCIARDDGAMREFFWDR